MAVRMLSSTQFDSKTYTDENSLVKLMLAEPDKISALVTYLHGEDHTRSFSFLSMTEGQGKMGRENTGKTKGINNVEYTYPVMESIPHTMRVVRVVGAGYGIGHSSFGIVFETNWAPAQYGLLAPDKQTQVQIHGEPKAVADGYLYTVQLKTISNTESCDLSNLVAGKSWVITAPNVTESGSRGNRSNVQGPGWVTNQISFKRYSKEIQGNLANKVVPIVFEGNNTTTGEAKTYWINEEMRQFEIWMRQMNNMDSYISTYNRDINGQIFMVDYENNKPIPTGSGVRETIESVGNYDTYGTTLTLQKLKTTVGDVFWGETDSKVMEVVIHAGQGFMEDFHEAVMNDIATQSMFIPVELTNSMNGKDGYLSYGKYFRQYKTITGHIVTVMHDTMFDVGLLGEMDKANGNLHPRTGYPMSSHTGVFMDYSVYGGERNVVLRYQEGQSYIAKVIPGMSPIPSSWGSVPQGVAATDIDNARYEVKMSRGINIKNPYHCFILSAE